MGLVDTKDEVEPTPEDPVKIETPAYRGITVDTEYVPSSALLAFIEGSRWTVEYYSQVLDAHNEPQQQILDRDAPWQQYRHLKGMELKVAQDLSYDEDPTTRVMTVSGSGYTFPFLVPNQGDMFIADIGDGKAGVFTVTSVRRSTIRKDSIYEISYTMVGDYTPERAADFERKTIETLVFSRKSLYQGCGPYLSTKEAADNATYQETLERLIQLYMGDFYSQEYSVLLVPDQGRPTYDHFISQFIVNLLGSQGDKRLRKIRTLNVSVDNVMRQPSIWDAVLTQDPTLVETGTRHTRVYYTHLFKGRPELKSLGYTGIAYLIYPLDNPTDVDSRYDNEDLIYTGGFTLRPGQVRRRQKLHDVPEDIGALPYYQGMTPSPDLDPALVPPDIHRADTDDYYVLSEAFYQQAEGQAKLELITRQYLEGEAINTEQLNRVLDHVYDWTSVERFYYYPLLFAILKYLS